MSEAVGARNMPRPKVCVTGDAGPSNIAYAPATSIQHAPDSGATRARVSTNWLPATASARSSRRARSTPDGMGEALMAVRSDFHYQPAWPGAEGFEARESSANVKHHAS